MIYEGQLEYAWLMIRYHQFSGAALSPYLPFIEQAVLFYDQHYRWRSQQLTGKPLGEDHKLVIYPANTLEAHWASRNPTSVIAGLQRVLGELINLPLCYQSNESKPRWQAMLATLPAMPTGSQELFGGTYLKPAENWEHDSWHCPEMYPLYPYELHGLGQGELALLLHTSLATGQERRDPTTWKQANIHAPRLGDIPLAQELNGKKMDNGPYRFPAFWPHDVDWAPDHNWGGSGMIGMQEMVLQTHSLPGEKGKLRLLPAWPSDWNVNFKLHAPYQTVLEGKFENGKLQALTLLPESRKADLVC